MPAYVWITALAAVAFVGFVALGRRWWHALWYSWRDARHVLADPLEEHYATVAMFYGSMNLADEQHHEEWLPAPTVNPAPWLEQTMAELSPEALDEAGYPCRAGDFMLNTGDLVDGPREVVLPDAGGWISGPCLDDPGPGVPPSSLTVAPGPVTDLDGGPTVSGPEGAEGVNAPAVQLGPNASRVLARWEQRFTERWSLSWDNSMEAAA